MQIKTIIMKILIITFFCFGCESQDQTVAEKDVKTVSINKTIEIPVQLLTSEIEKEKLTITVGSEDELPQGPSSFDILEDGFFVFADLLTQRLVFYDSSGIYDREISLPFAPLQVRRYTEDSLLVKRRSTETTYLIQNDGSVLLMDEFTWDITSSDDQARLVNNNRGLILRYFDDGRKPYAVCVQPLDPEKTMVSIQSFGETKAGGAYVFLEQTAGGYPIKVEKGIQIYNQNSVLAAQITNISLDYFIVPEDAFRVSKGKIYQMLPLRDKILINIWETN